MDRFDADILADCQMNDERHWKCVTFSNPFIEWFRLLETSVFVIYFMMSVPDRQTDQ